MVFGNLVLCVAFISIFFLYFFFFSVSHFSLPFWPIVSCNFCSRKCTIAIALFAFVLKEALIWAGPDFIWRSLSLSAFHLVCFDYSPQSDTIFTRAPLTHNGHAIAIVFYHCFSCTLFFSFSFHLVFCSVGRNEIGIFMSMSMYCFGIIKSQHGILFLKFTLDRPQTERQRKPKRHRYQPNKFLFRWKFAQKLITTQWTLWI